MTEFFTMQFPLWFVLIVMAVNSLITVIIYQKRK